MRIPVDQVNPETLRNIAEGFVLREGTDYGPEETALSDKVDQVMAQLQNGDAILVYSELHETVDIITRQEWQQRQSQNNA